MPTLVFGNVDRRYVQCQSRPRAGAHDRLVAFARPSPCAAFALAVEATAGAVVAVNEFGVLAAGAENATRINGVPEDRMRVGRKSHASPLETDSCFHRSDIGDLDIGQKSAFGPRLRPFLAEPDDQALLAKGSFVYEALYAWCQEGEEAYWPRPCPA